MTEQFRDSPRVHKFCPAISDTVYDPFFSDVKKNTRMLPQLYAEPGISQLIEEPGCSFASMTLRHIINNDVTTFLNKERREARKFQPHVLQTKPDPVFVLLLPATLENW